jgi:hypothetical protein
VGKQNLHLRRIAFEDVAVGSLKQVCKEAHELLLLRFCAVPPVGAEGLLGHLQKSELGKHDPPHFLASLLAAAVALEGGIPEHQLEPPDGGAERVLRRLCGPHV